MRESMEIYPRTAAERAMKLQEVLLRATLGKIKWWQAAELIGISERQMRRWRKRLEVILTLVGFHVVLPNKRIPDFFESPGLLDQLPDPGTHRIQTVMYPASHIQDGGFPGQVA